MKKMKIQRPEPCEVKMKTNQFVQGAVRQTKKWRVRFTVGAYFAFLMTLLAPINPVHAPVIDATKAQAVNIDSKMYARALASMEYKWDSEELKCLGKLWGKESAWNHEAESPTQDYGIPQRHMSRNTQEEIKKFLNNPLLQVSWGLNYIDHRYGSPCEAWAHHEKRNWY